MLMYPFSFYKTNKIRFKPIYSTLAWNITLLSLQLSMSSISKMTTHHHRHHLQWFFHHKPNLPWRWLHQLAEDAEGEETHNQDQAQLEELDRIGPMMVRVADRVDLPVLQLDTHSMGMETPRMISFCHKIELMANQCSPVFFLLQL